jgi:SAM-dependent methyltransferase
MNACVTADQVEGLKASNGDAEAGEGLAPSVGAPACQKPGPSSQATQAAVQALAADPRDRSALKVLARSFLNGGQYQAAEKTCQRILRLDPQDAEAGQMIEETAEKAKPAKNLSDMAIWVEGRRRRQPAAPQRIPPVGGRAITPEQARRDLEQFLAAGDKFFEDVVPPKLTSAELKNSRILPSREDILPLLPKGMVCAELGTQTGSFARKILAAIHPSRLHLYDTDFTPFDFAYFQAVIDAGVVELHHGDAASLLSAMPDRHFGLIYIDADHSYAGVRRDLEQAALKIQDDGWIVCNDYAVFSPLEGIKYGVCRAVNELCLRQGFEILYLGLHPWGYHDVAIRRRPNAHLGGSYLDAPDENLFMPDVWEHLIGKYGIASVLDVGAGGGWSTKWFADRGLFVLGIEGWKEALERSQCPSLMIEHDYTRGEFVPARAFDLAWCCEFVEHVEEQFIPNFMASFRACKYVCMTHGDVGQIGYHHVNCQPTAYWIAKMKDNGFEQDPQETGYLRSTNTHNAPWGRNTLTFFVNRKIDKT